MKLKVGPVSYTIRLEDIQQGLELFLGPKPKE